MIATKMSDGRKVSVPIFMGREFKFKLFGSDRRSWYPKLRSDSFKVPPCPTKELYQGDWLISIFLYLRYKEPNDYDKILFINKIDKERYIAKLGSLATIN